MNKGNKILEYKYHYGVKVALIERDTSFCRYVVAYSLYDDGTWGQGHYFESYESAKNYYDNEY